MFADPCYLGISDLEKTCVEAEIDAIIQSTTSQERRLVNPSIILEEFLSAKTDFHLAPTLTPTNPPKSFWDYFSCAA